MITTEITQAQIEVWKKIYSENKDKIKVNRISGFELDEYFNKKYHPTKNTIKEFEDVVCLNLKENGVKEPLISTYILDDNVYVGIDLKSGFFQVECENIEKMTPIWDDLFLTRGLGADDISNYVLVAQYITLLDKKC